MNDIREIATNLQFPEGPIALADGSILLVEVRGRTLTRIAPDGTRDLVVDTGGGPNGAAVGPDGAVYICNNGGLEWIELGGIVMPGNQSADYCGGSIQRVDLESKEVTTLYSACGDVALKGPNDIVFDSSGGFWFTDHGKLRERERDRTGVFYAQPDGKHIQEVIFPLDAPNGIGLSPDESRLYVAETFTGRVFMWDLVGPGTIRPNPRSMHGGYLLTGLPGMQYLDSLAVDIDGNVCVATIVNGGITIVSADDGSTQHVAMPDPVTTNICFGGADRKTSYITLSGTGRLVAVSWKTPGLRLAF